MARAIQRWLPASAGLLFAAGAATAATLGDIDVQSRPGQPLVASIVVEHAAGERLESTCVFLSRGSPETGPYVTGAKVAFEARGTSLVLHVRSNDPVANPASRLRIVLRCPGETTFAYREYASLFAARAATLAPIAPALASPAPAPVPDATARPLARGGFPVQPGDSMDSIAGLIFPRESAARRDYVEALREANPALGSLAPREPLPPGSSLSLPDLRTFARGHSPVSPTPHAQAPRDPAPAKPRVAQAPLRAATPAAPPKAADVPAAPRSPTPTERKKPAPAHGPGAADTAPGAPALSARAPATAPSGSPFVLKLSSGEVDLSRSRNIDDRERARIRERQRVLDSDDHVAAFLALRDSVQRLEGRVAELQLKLSTLSAAQSRIVAAEPAPPKPAPKVEPPPPAAKATPAKTAEPAKVESPKVEPQKVEPPKIEPPKVEPPKVEPPKAEARAPEPSRPAPPKAETPAPVKAAAQAKPVESDSGLPTWLWGVVGVLVVLMALLAWRLVSRRRELVDEAGPASDELALPDAPAVEATDLGHFELDDEAAPIDVAAPIRREMESDATLATKVHSGDPAALRRRYIEERFPEVVNRTIVLEDPDSVVKAARLFYQDGAIPRAVELLQYATEENSAQVKPWLALFEIYRLERLTAEFADLARRFKEHHGKAEHWRKVQFFGREIEPANSLYRDLAIGIETIKFEAGKPPPAATYDPVAENWLAAPMDFENEVLASELRRGLLNQAGLSDQDLMPNPMPALRRVEMFTVA